jgi:hypothetical protein
MSKYVFYDDSYCFSNGCNCCEDIYMEAYNSDDTRCGMGSANSEEDCYIQAILTELGEGFETDTADNLHTLSLEQLKDSASFLKIEVEIVS